MTNELQVVREQYEALLGEVNTATNEIAQGLTHSISVAKAIPEFPQEWLDRLSAWREQLLAICSAYEPINRPASKTPGAEEIE